MEKLKQAKKLSLSCVETYLIYYLMFQEQSIGKIFFDSYWSFTYIIEYMRKNKTSYAFFNGIERLQDKCKKLGFVNFSMYKDNEFLKAIDDDCIVMIQGESVALREKYNIELWRNDHFLMLKKEQGGIKIINENPISIIDKEDVFLSKVYAGKYLYYKYYRKVFLQFDPVFCVKDNLEMENKIKSYDYSYEQIRDAILVYRVCLNRIICFMRYLRKRLDFKEILEEIDRKILQIEYARIKQNSNMKNMIFMWMLQVQHEVNTILKRKETL